jgi:hypothetical protein
VAPAKHKKTSSPNSGPPGTQMAQLERTLLQPGTAVVRQETGENNGGTEERQTNRGDHRAPTK